MARRKPKRQYRIPTGDSLTDRINDHAKSALDDLTTIVAEQRPKPTGTPLKKATTKVFRLQAEPDNWLMLQQDNNITIIPPIDPDIGTSFGIRGTVQDATSITIDPGGVQLEDPHAMGTFHSSSFAISGSGLMVEWTWMGEFPVRWWLTGNNT